MGNAAALTLLWLALIGLVVFMGWIFVPKKKAPKVHRGLSVLSTQKGE